MLVLFSRPLLKGMKVSQCQPDEIFIVNDAQVGVDDAPRTHTETN